MKGEQVPPRGGGVYLVRLDPTEGSEQAGTRPAVVVSREAINRYSPVIVICPLTDAAHVPKLYPSDVRIQALGGSPRTRWCSPAGCGRSLKAVCFGAWGSSTRRQWSRWSEP